MMTSPAQPLAALILLLSTMGAPAASPLLDAVTNAPAVIAARLRLEAMESRRESAGRLADPQLEGGYGRKQMPDDENDMWDVSLQQPLPKPGERAADRRRADAQLALARAAYAQAAGDTAAAAASSLTEAETARHHLALAERQRTRTARMLEVLDARIATGQGRTAERLALQTRLADLRLLAARYEQLAWDAESTARATLGLPPTAPLPPYDAPATNAVSAADSPTVRAANARAREADAMAAAARASRLPMTAVGLRFEREELDDGNEDTLGLSLMTELPWHSRRYARADYAAARAEQDASAAEADAAHLALAALLGRVERAELLAATARNVAAETEARLEAEHDALVGAAGAAGMGQDLPLLMLLELLDRRAMVERERVETEGAARMARADLWSHVPESLLLNTEEGP